MKTLIKKLNNYTSAYDEGRPLISDAEWDRMYFELKKMEEEIENMFDKRLEFFCELR